MVPSCFQRLDICLRPNLCKSPQRTRQIHTAKLWAQKTLNYLAAMNRPIWHSLLTLGEHFEKYMKKLRIQIFVSFKLKNSQKVISQSHILRRVSLVCLCRVHVIKVPYFSVSCHNISEVLCHCKRTVRLSIISRIVIITRKYWGSLRQMGNFWFEVHILFVISRDFFLFVWEK